MDMIRVVEATMEINPEEDEGKPPDDGREACLMCGACEVLGEGCVLHAETVPGAVNAVVEDDRNELLKLELNKTPAL